ncbi:hypothetical protein WA026_014779 [Henosepilachna vigintioctopunctata]|uniref:Uncharacterized protein n=1 Tax=Henosepilachna vigintioctopunctata TaxID=420089 RepID=A0AAW1UZR4_9CUCU
MSTEATNNSLAGNDKLDQSKLESASSTNDDVSNLQRTSSVLSVSSVASSASGIPVKKTSIKAPSRIGRPCAGQQKPAVPSSPSK